MVVYAIVAVIMLINFSLVASAFDWKMSERVLMMFAGQTFIIFLMVLAVAIIKYFILQF